ncbi:hypothetical protein [Micropruina sp.]|uniref:hypothetical protein n=1 Tax=Micropruina sp. TaxID=2737536 RepID=UPI0039E36E1F
MASLKSSRSSSKVTSLVLDHVVQPRHAHRGRPTVDLRDPVGDSPRMLDVGPSDLVNLPFMGGGGAPFGGRQGCEGRAFAQWNVDGVRDVAWVDAVHVDQRLHGGARGPSQLALPAVDADPPVRVPLRRAGEPQP